jgi:hypothetical protein
MSASSVLAFLLVLACHPGPKLAAAAGMSAPPAPATAIESIPAAQFLPSHFDWHGLADRQVRVSFVLVALGAIHETGKDTRPYPPQYGPLHRRPPPSFS